MSCCSHLSGPGLVIVLYATVVHQENIYLQLSYMLIILPVIHVLLHFSIQSGMVNGPSFNALYLAY
jgi:hypothetical protein